MSVKLVQQNEELIKGQIKELVRSSAEETLNAVSYTHLLKASCAVIPYYTRILAGFQGFIPSRRTRIPAIARRLLRNQPQAPYSPPFR